jgi:hypothetical protein
MPGWPFSRRHSGSPFKAGASGDQSLVPELAGRYPSIVHDLHPNLLFKREPDG